MDGKNPKLKTLAELLRIRKQLSRENKKVVVYNGSFDIFHCGHLASIREARQQGDILIILVNSDKSVRSYKGPTRPIISEGHRADLLTGLEAVDYVTLFDEVNPKLLLARLKPDIYCSGSNWGKNCIERPVVESYGGKVYVLKEVAGISTSAIIDKITHLYKVPVKKGIFIPLDDVGEIGELPDGPSRSDFDIFLLSDKHSGLDLGKLSYKVAGVLEIRQGEEEFDNNINRLLMLAERSGLCLDKSWILSSNVNDIILARETNVSSVKVGDRIPKEFKIEPNRYVRSYTQGLKVISSAEISKQS
jgi:rfaE bifunctional protein nucleotidyltransferase chain/domain